MGQLVKIDRNRNHFYLFTVEVKDERVDENNKKFITWNQHQVQGCNLHEVAGKLKVDLSDIRYITKEIIR
jgi:hypothetical protein